MSKWWEDYRGWVNEDVAVAIFEEFSGIDEFYDFLMTYPEWYNKALTKKLHLQDGVNFLLGEYKEGRL